MRLHSFPTRDSLKDSLVRYLKSAALVSPSFHPSSLLDFSFSCVCSSSNPRSRDTLSSETDKYSSSMIFRIKICDSDRSNPTLISYLCSIVSSSRKLTVTVF